MIQKKDIEEILEFIKGQKLEAKADEIIYKERNDQLMRGYFSGKVVAFCSVEMRLNEILNGCSVPSGHES